MKKMEIQPMDDRAFRDIVGNFCTGVTIITTMNGDLQPIGFTANSFSSLSLNPKLVLFSIDKNASTYKDFMNTEHFAVNILSTNQLDLSKQFSKRGINRFEGVNFTKDVTGSPILNGSLAYLDCKITNFYEGGDHTIVIGEVLSADAREEKPLAFFQGKYIDI
ncbi:flavin reductase family protein [Psychrobacillus sp. OK032]|uniref:flavin reductase family protein n=1 Tax=Psychrobacillus sp. OK032 TaxID=1884358 RepID=UPI0008D77B20|nr:flavin reductase family protein [Psychrobacillus sp. OK032]SER86626.1 3-hydroxy-9,10-secoandrosta-1,3,5(10)-triene-9,17-dione monooxygenase reductase component [Psychrobacillus sp. OK032]